MIPQISERFRYLCIGLFLMVPATHCCAQDTGTLEFRVIDASGALLPCRVHLSDAEGSPQRPPRLPFWKDHFVCPGEASLELPPGDYRWAIERGPEFRRLSGTVVVAKDKKTQVTKTLPRLVTLRDSGWYSADLHVHRAVAEIGLLMVAEDLDFAPVIGWWNQPAPNAALLEETEFLLEDGRLYCIGAGEDEREGGALLYLGLKQPLDLSVKSREFPSPIKFVRSARRQNPKVWIDIEKPFWWDVPTWLAVANPNSIGICHNHMHRDGVLANEAWGRPRELETYPGPHGNGLWTQQIYYHILNSGIRIPPSAGSASGVLPNPVGYNRVYVQIPDSALTREAWFRGLENGRCFVTNGPLLRVRANGALPGADIALQAGASIDLEIELDSNDPIAKLEVIHNGQVVQRIPCSNEPHQVFKTTVPLSEPGWFLVRAIADIDNTFRFASTAPWYVPSEDGSLRISQRSAQFFLKWMEERIDRIQKNVSDPQQRDSVLQWHYQAREFWRQKFLSAKTDLLFPRNETLEQLRQRLCRAITRFGGSEKKEVLRDLEAAESRYELEKALEPLVALNVSINPESRVKVSSVRPKLVLQRDRAELFLVKIDNTAGITAPLSLTAMDVSKNPPAEALWCSIDVVDGPVMSRYLSGADTEFKVMRITPHEEGLREVRIEGNAGQGTQDLGFRATTDVLLEVSPSPSKRGET